MLFLLPKIQLTTSCSILEARIHRAYTEPLVTSALQDMQIGLFLHCKPWHSSCTNQLQHCICCQARHNYHNATGLAECAIQLHCHMTHVYLQA